MRSKYKDRQKPLHQLTPDELRAQAETRFRKAEQQKADAPPAMREYREAEQMLRDRTARLRAERLARQTSDKP
jgi:hypothetical protein